ncbi:MAG: hypothetical protein Q9162_003239 [Coniocarpon cinnabarinum]
MARPIQQPLEWTDDDGVQVEESSGSYTSARGFAFRPHNPSPGTSTSQTEEANNNIIRRRSSVTQTVTAIGDAGGVNSFNNFARSWQRAAVFPEYIGGRQCFVNPEQDDNHIGDIERLSSHERPFKPQRSLLRAALENEGQNVPEHSVVEEAETSEDDAPPQLSAVERRLSQRRSSPHLNSVRHLDPGLMSPLIGSYGTVPARLDEASIISSRPVPQIARPEGARPSDRESEPLLVKQDDEEGKPTLSFVIGQSTVPQTVFNSVNTLIGVGMLSLPLALKYSGWLFGVGFFLFASVATSYTAKLLAKCLSVDNSLITFADLAYISFGSRARIAVSILFCLELVASCVALVVLFADSMNALVDVWGTLEFKIMCGVIIMPLAFVPLRFLSFSSVLGIVCCFTIVMAVFVDGMIKPSSPGSLRQPATTTPTPSTWRTLPLAFGLLMAPWGGHSVFPNIYRDMRHPMKYGKAVNYTYAFTFSLELVIAVIGYVMFGEEVLDEVTSNIFRTREYPRWLSYVIAIAVCIIPLTKVPLNARPIYSTAEFFLGLTRPASSAPLGKRRSATTRAVLTVLLRLLLTVVFVIIAILIPSFDRIMALLGSLACSLVCIVLPCAFHLKIFGEHLSFRQKLIDGALISIFLLGGIIGTVFACLPKHTLGAS